MDLYTDYINTMKKTLKIHIGKPYSSKYKIGDRLDFSRSGTQSGTIGLRMFKFFNGLNGEPELRDPINISVGLCTRDKIIAIVPTGVVVEDDGSRRYRYFIDETELERLNPIIIHEEQQA